MMTEAQAIARVVRMRLPSRPAVLQSSDDITGGPLAGEIARRRDAALVLSGLDRGWGPHGDTARVIIALVRRGLWVRYHTAHAAVMGMRDADATVESIADFLIAEGYTVPLEDGA